ncbi:hypothetical protein SFRURICE_012440 [Spodoptera frugiperda]|nr:hypothetical protein SFRURICE_012440 [Spodoptera frugiperda]
MYCNWRIAELKDELKKRGASFIGKKDELIERLELNDQNSIYVSPECRTDEDPKMKLPKTYQALNSDTILPPLDKTMIRHYLGYTEKKMNNIMQLYKSRI